MTDNDLIQVLWVEDDPDVLESYPDEACGEGLELVSYLCWDDAKTALECEFNRWSAIILDAKCKYHRDSKDSAIVFLREALKDISTICKEKNRVIPWYILTGGDEIEVSDCINDDRLKWDADWTVEKHKKFYSKVDDREELYRRIRVHAQKSCRIQIQELYRDVYGQLSDFNGDVCEDILTILEAIHFPNSHRDFNPKYFYNPLRQALEHVFRSMGEVNVIPDSFFSNDIVNLNQCFMYIIGKEAEKLGYKHKEGGITPRHISDMMSLIINLGNANSHSFIQSHSTKLSDEEIQKFENHIKASGCNSKLLIFSIALQFCEILQWTNRYIKKHPDKEENRKNWVKIEKTERENDQKDLENGKDYEGIIIKVKNDKGIFLNVKCELYPYPLQIKPRQNDLKEADIVIFKAVQETNKNNSSKFYWIASEVRSK